MRRNRDVDSLGAPWYGGTGVADRPFSVAIYLLAVAGAAYASALAEFRFRTFLDET